MLGFTIVLLTVILLLDCIVLVLLVLMQLPKKEAGAGLAFGGAATDALFGAGSGNFLTKATKYTAGIFFALAVLLSVLQPQYYRRSDARFRRGVEMQGRQAQTPSTSTETGPGSAPIVAPTNQTVPVLRMMPLATNSPSSTNH